MAYYPLQPGKRIRPIITLAVADILGGNEEDALTVGCAIEMVHNYSLVHDDLPAMDNDEVRRGKPTCHVRFGEATAILAGDALLTYAFEVLSKEETFQNLSPSQVLKVIHILALKSGVRGMVGGQVLDIKGKEALEEISLMKTGALFEASFMCGGIVAGREDVIEELEKLGRSFGLLFQITDDILDRDGYFELLGREGAYAEAQKIYEDCLKAIRKIFSDRGSILEYLLNKVYTRVGE